MDGNVLQAISAVCGWLLIQFVIYPALGKGWRALDKNKLAEKAWFVFKVANVAAVIFLVVATCSKSGSGGCQSFGRGVETGDC